MSTSAMTSGSHDEPRTAPMMTIMIVVSIEKFKKVRWNATLILNAAEPFEEPSILSVEDRVGPNKDDILGRCKLPLQYVERRLDHKAINTRRFNLKKHVMVVDGEKKKEVNHDGTFGALPDLRSLKSELRCVPVMLQMVAAGLGGVTMDLRILIMMKALAKNKYVNRMSVAKNKVVFEFDMGILLRGLLSGNFSLEPAANWIVQNENDVDSVFRSSKSSIQESRANNVRRHQGCFDRHPILFGAQTVKDVPLGGEMDELMENPGFDEEEELNKFMDNDQDEEVDEWLMAPVTPPRAFVTVPSTYEVGGPSTATPVGHTLTTMASGVATQPQVIDDLCIRMSNLEYRHGELNQQLQTRLSEMENREGTLISFMCWMEDRLVVL
nr:FT-interacting protein 1-like [Tanacetum cinerariifolium]